MKEDNRTRFRVEERLYQEFKMFHLNFLETTQYSKVNGISSTVISSSILIRAVISLKSA